MTALSRVEGCKNHRHGLSDMRSRPAFGDPESQPQYRPHACFDAGVQQQFGANLQLFRVTDSLDEVFDVLTRELRAHFPGEPRGTPDLG